MGRVDPRLRARRSDQAIRGQRRGAIDVVTCSAHAKINLSLEVIGRRPDGYHDIVSIFQTIDLHDVVQVSLSDELSLECDDPALRGTSNLVWRAAALLRQRAGVRPCAHIRLFKAIPVGAGLGGGSADAAVTLVALDHLWRLALSYDELLALAAELGSDVPYFLAGGTALVRGRGEQVEPLPDLPSRWLVLLCPEVGLPGKTTELYRRLGPDLYDDGQYTQTAARQIAAGQFPAETLLRNTFEKVAESAFPGLSRARAQLLAAAGRPVHLSGSGPSLYAVFADRREAELTLTVLHRQAHRAYLARVGAWRCSVGSKTNPIIA